MGSGLGYLCNRKVRKGIDMKSAEFLKEMLQNGERIRNIDLAGVHGDMVAEMVEASSGGDFWKDNFRNFLDKVRDGSYPTTTDFKTVLQYTEGTDCLVDGILVSSVSARQGESGLGVAFSYSFAENVAELYWAFSFPELGVASCGGMAPVCRNREEVYWELGKEVSAAEGLLQVSWRCMEGDMVKSQVQRVSVTLAGSVSLDWSVTDPVRKKDSRNDFILVVYGREAKGAEQPDYEKRVQLSPDGKSQELLLQCGGEVICGEEIRNALAMGLVMDTGHGMAASKGLQVSFSGRKLIFSQAEDWNAYVPTKRLCLEDKAYLAMAVGVQFANGEWATLRLNSVDSGWVPQDEASRAYKGSGIELKIHTLRMLWGCVAEDTIVTLADGRERRICDLKQGDCILSGDGSVAEISTVYSGEEKELYVLELADGRKLKGTGTHPVMTPAGFKALKDILCTDQVQTQDGSMQQAVSVRKEPYGGKVYNLQLCDGKKGMYCNGILAGDFITENSGKRSE